MTVKTELADGTFEFFESSNYKVSTIKDMHPMIVKVTIFENAKKIASFSRPCKWFYKHFTFKSEKVQNELKKIKQENEMRHIAEEAKRK